jgi:hypothetical protein
MPSPIRSLHPSDASRGHLGGTLPLVARFAAAFVVVGLAGPAWATGAPAVVGVMAPIDYAAQFDKSFPAVAGEHKVVDWTLYAALVNGDLLGYAARVDPAIARRRDLANGKGAQLQELTAGVQRDKRLRSAFDEQRQRIATMVLYADGSPDGCRRPIVLIGSELRLVLGRPGSQGDPLASTEVAPSCPPPFESGAQASVGYSPRFRCWAGINDKTCGWRLPDMPAELKRVIEEEYPGSIRLRWRWRGLGGVTQVRDRFSLSTPGELGLEFVDGKGQVLWTAEGARIVPPIARPRPLKPSGATD